jgi:anti-sigma B factor antagonist
MADEFSIQQLDHPEGPVALRVSGQLNAKSTPALLDRCREVKAAGKPLALNLSGVSFIASSGIGGLLALAEEFSEAGLRVRFAELSAAVDSVIKLLNLDSFLGIDGSEAESLAELSR